MKQKNLMILLSIVALVVSSFMIAGNVGAMYMRDGAVQDGVSGGWKAPTDFVCIVGVHANGTLDIADGVTDRHTCQYLTKGTMNGGTPFDLSTMTTSAACTTAGGTGNDGAKHAFATSICVDSTGAGLSLVGLDRTYTMCVQKGGTWKQTSATPPYPGAAGTYPTPGFVGTCTAYGGQFKGQDATGTPLAFGTKGTVQGLGTGYCYASLDMTSLYTAATCPAKDSTSSSDPTNNGLTAVNPNTGYNSNSAYDWAWTGTKCTYAKGIAGYLPSKITKANGTTYAAGSYLDLSAFATMGDCLANGGSWNNWTGQATSTTSLATIPNSTIPAWDYTKNTPDADNGCLHCHSSAVEYNGPAERWKDSYLKTGHKNMLRKVTAGMNWAGPDGVVYTTDGTNSINFMTTSDPFAKVTVAGVDQNLYYIYGDWMIALPTLVYGTNGYGVTIGANNGYSCYACHTTGASDSGNIGVQGIGTSGYAGVQPQASFPGINLNAANPKWDLDGINCSRCHNAAVGPVNSTTIGASTFTTTAPTSGGMGALASGTGRNNLCFGCHQSIAKTWPAQGGAATGTTQYDPTLIPVGVSHGAAAGRDFNGHVLGNSFLNSVHARYVGAQSGNGSIKMNSLGKFDLTDPNGTSEYNSIFKGYTCWQNSTTNSPAKTKADGSEITTKSECETLYGTGSWRADQDGSLAPTSVQGTCTTCHDVHNSLFVTSQSEKAIRKSCTDCHVNNSSIGATDASAPQVVPSAINHPMTPGTPFDTTLYGSDPCAVCHMATQAVQNGTQNSMPAHVWRINPDPNYNTFPTTGQFYGGACSVHAGAVQNAPSLPAVYLSDTTSAACTTAGGTWTAVTKDRNAQTTPEYTSTGSQTYPKAVWVDLDMACGQCHGGSITTTTVNNAPYMNKAQLAGLAAGMHSAGAPVASFIYTDDPGTSYLVNFDASLSFCPSGDTCVYTWNFGDGSPITGPATSTSANYTYASAGNYTVKLTVIDTTSQATATFSSTVAATKVNIAPTASFTTSVAGLTVTVTDASTAGNNGNVTGTVIWGDGSASSQVLQGQSVQHTYAAATSYVIQYSVTDGVMTSISLTQRVTTVLSYVTVSGKVFQHDNTTAISGATVNLYTSAGTLIKRAISGSNGSYSLTSVASGTYSLRATYSGRTFNNVPVTVTNSPVTQNMVAN